MPPGRRALSGSARLLLTILLLSRVVLRFPLPAGVGWRCGAVVVVVVNYPCSGSARLAGATSPAVYYFLLPAL